jgi:uncharacterized protein (TIGR00297 family)
VAGTAAVLAGWSWGFLLVAHFVAASALSSIGRARKAKILTPIVEKGDQRDVWQVFANGGLFSAAALASVISDSPVWYALGIGALAASAADTWATEVGTLAPRDPISIVSGKRVPTGTSGGISVRGSLAALGGALFIAVGTALARWPVSFTAVALGGIVGAVSDSLIGATIQSRRWCNTCALPTERKIHVCGTRTRQIGGHDWLDNDAVNAICCVVGGVITILLR